ncbi:unnamed protein product [Cylicostephanus goldi]|uniref:Uncharacterized protein n=1 Tax=Cylicostephanus goldi TaxID=71465 RepID=A0A3P7MFU3_CYLGO|nr:unnamed protein product [Cylicostephanus goldi]
MANSDPIYDKGTACRKDAECTIEPSTHCDATTGLCEVAATTTAATTTAAATTGVTTEAMTTSASYRGELPTGTYLQISNHSND